MILTQGLKWLAGKWRNFLTVFPKTRLLLSVEQGNQFGIINVMVAGRK